ncbi:MAG: DUF1223 domain-containing protein [Phycisphaeraceae bacterium]|nr:DUF1223 domain-containing protein [Phycisphaeraceae bacterium]
MIAILMVLVSLQFASLQPEVPVARGQSKPVAVVELFTSEGCSSCPPADRLLAELIEQHAKSGDLIALSFHVDYWNSLGWKDPWSSAAATERQQGYRAGLGERSLYTPQMVVGGWVGFVGSDRVRAEREIAAELRREKQVAVTSVASWKGGTKLGTVLRVSTQLKPSGESERNVRKWTVLVALVEKGLEADVRRGENAGKKLAHENVVRAFANLEASADTEANLDLAIPADVEVDRAALVVLVQAAPGRPIAGATLISLPERKDPVK